MTPTPMAFLSGNPQVHSLLSTSKKFSVATHRPRHPPTPLLPVTQLIPQKSSLVCNWKVSVLKGPRKLLLSNPWYGLAKTLVICRLPPNKDEQNKQTPKNQPTWQQQWILPRRDPGKKEEEEKQVRGTKTKRFTFLEL